MQSTDTSRGSVHQDLVVVLWMVVYLSIYYLSQLAFDVERSTFNFQNEISKRWLYFCLSVDNLVTIGFSLKPFCERSYHLGEPVLSISWPFTTMTTEVSPEPIKPLEQNIAAAINDEVWCRNLVICAIQSHEKVIRLHTKHQCNGHQVQLGTNHHCAPDAAYTKEGCEKNNAIEKLKDTACLSCLVQEPTSEARLHHHGISNHDLPMDVQKYSAPVKSMNKEQDVCYDISLTAPKTRSVLHSKEQRASKWTCYSIQALS